MKRLITIVLLTGSFILCLCGQEKSSADSLLSAVESFYNSAQYSSAELEARRLYESERISDSVKVQCEKWIAFSLIAQGKPNQARERFVNILTVNPDFDLDRVFTSPKILAIFNDARSKFLSQKKSIDTTHFIAANHSHQLSFRSVVFPGWEQIHQEENTKGFILFGTGAISLGAGIAFEILRSSARDSYMKAATPSDIASKYQTYNRYRKAEIYSFISFGVIYIISEIDLFNYPSAYSLTLTPGYSGTFGTMLTMSAKF